MSAVEFALVLALAALCITWIVRDDRRTRRAAAFDRVVDDALKLSGPRPAPTDANPAASRSSCVPGEGTPSGRSPFHVDSEWDLP